MALNLRKLSAGHAYDGKALEFSRILDLSAVKLWGGHPFLKPVTVSGAVEFRSDIFTIRYRAVFEMQGVCSRCLAPVERDESREFVHTILIGPEDGEASDGSVMAPDGELDLDGLVISDLLLEYGGVMLCGEGCRGLCPKCGGNLNMNACGCDLSEPDPRFQVLRDFLDENK